MNRQSFSLEINLEPETLETQSITMNTILTLNFCLSKFKLLLNFSWFCRGEELS